MDNVIRTIHELATGRMVDLGFVIKGEHTDYRKDIYELNYSDEKDVLSVIASGAIQSQLEKLIIENNLYSNMTPEEKQYLQDMAFGRSFITRILNQIKTLDGLTTAQRLSLLNTIKDAMNTLLWGDVEVSRAAFNATATTSLFTQARKDWVLAQLDAHMSTQL